MRAARPRPPTTPHRPHGRRAVVTALAPLLASALSLVGVVGVVGVGGCGGAEDAAGSGGDASLDASAAEGGFDGAIYPLADGGGGRDASDGATGGALDAGGDVVAAPCTTRVTYGGAWIAPAGHATNFDDVDGAIGWDGRCVDDGANSYALLSNGWKPYFAGHSACAIALDQSAACAPSGGCATRITYGGGWLAPAGHAASFDDVDGAVYTDGVCVSGDHAVLSNGWQPHFSGGSCPLSLRWTQCGGLYRNPVIAGDCPDPGVLHDGGRYILTCTSGNAADAFPIYTSTDLTHWAMVGHVFPSGSRPSWAKSDFWAPEIHKVGAQYVVYFSARDGSGMLRIGAGSAADATGPFTDRGSPLVTSPTVGLIDASEINASAGGPYVLWKEDGNASGKPTPIRIAPLSADGLTVTGAATTLIENDRAWEGAVTEGPFMIEHAGQYVLFYSGNSYANATYAVGAARASAPTGPFTKEPAPILTTSSSWVGPGHCSVVDGPDGASVMVYHAWKAGCVNAPGCGRETMVDRVAWDGSGAPSVQLSPSANDRPAP